MTTAATVVLLNCSSTSAQDICGLIGDVNDTQLEVDQIEMFYLDSDHPARCSGNITSWRVCYYGPKAMVKKSYAYHVKYAVYRPERNGTTCKYHLVPGSISSITLRRMSNGGNRSRHTRSSTHNKKTSRPEYDQFYTDGFYCYEQSLDAHVFVEEGNVVGACVVNPKGMMKQLDIVSRVNNVNGQSPDSVRLYGTNQYVKLCQDNKLTDIPTIIMTDQFSAVNSTRLHLSANITAIGRL